MKSAKINPRKRKPSAKLMITTIKNTTRFALLVFAMIIGVNETLVKNDAIPSSAEVARFFDCGPKPYVELAEGESSVSFIDVGQGDCELIRTTNRNILIDSGNRGMAGRVINFLQYLGITKLDMVIVTHPHDDHYVEMKDIIGYFAVGQFIMPQLPEDLTPKTVYHLELLRTLENRGIPIKYIKAGECFTLEDDSRIEFLAPIYDDYEDMNNFSIVTRFVHGERSFLFTGDIERMGELDLVESDVDIKADVLKIPHHGSANSNSEEFLKAVSPEIAVACAAVDNDYYHPRASVIYRLRDAGCSTTYSTANNGTVVIISDGKDLRVVCERNHALEL